MKKIIDKIKAEKEIIKSINLSSQYELFELPEIIQECKSLEKLDISFNEIREIPEYIFRLPKLKELNFARCSEIQNQVIPFSSSQPLEKLSLCANGSGSFFDDIEKLTTLKSLTLNGKISEIPKAIFNLSSLQELILYDTQIATVPSEIKKLKSLKKFAINQLPFTPEDSFIKLNLEEAFENLSQCENLKELNLNYNGIKQIPEKINLLKQLEVFLAQDNLLVSYPKAIHNLTKLKELNFGVNHLKEIPTGIGQLSQLKTLKLNSNWQQNFDVKNLFDEIDQLTVLEILDLHSCQSIKEIPETISSLTKLKKLDLDNNLITKLPKSILNMTHLNVLRIGSNKVAEKEIAEIKGSLTSTKIY